MGPGRDRTRDKCNESYRLSMTCADSRGEGAGVSPHPGNHKWLYDFTEILVRAPSRSNWTRGSRGRFVRDSVKYVDE